MHPPLFKPHPLCEREVAALVSCHAANPIMKFLDACGGHKAAMDACFRDEKKLRVSLNRRITDPLDAAPATAHVSGGGDGGAAGGGRA